VIISLCDFGYITDPQPKIT